MIRVAEVVRYNELDLLAEHAAGGIEILDRGSGAALELLAEPRLRAGHWAGHANPDLGRRGPHAEQRQDDRYGKNDGWGAHGGAFVN